MNILKRRETGMAGLLIAAFSLPYTVGWGWDWWKFAVSTLLILVIWRAAKPTRYREELGLPSRTFDFASGFLCAAIAALSAASLIPVILRSHGYVAKFDYDATWLSLAVPFQTLNEEMVLRAFLLTCLGHFVRVRLSVNVAVALVFAGLHFALYRFGPPHSLLSVSALMTLFLIGLAFNEFFVATGSIAIPCGIHLGWNLTRFGREWIHRDSGSGIEQGVDFNLIEGDSKILALALGLAVIAMIIRLCRDAESQQNVGPKVVEEARK